MLKKPEWLIYAQGVRVMVDKMKPTKSGKRESEAIYRAWLTACREKGYPGSERDWKILVRRLGRF